MIGPVPICFMCKHYVPGMDEENPLDVPVCAAFPNGIPDEILKQGYDHREPLGNESILFELGRGYTEEDLAEWEEEMVEDEKADVMRLLNQLEPDTE